MTGNVYETDDGAEGEKYVVADHGLEEELEKLRGGDGGEDDDE